MASIRVLFRAILFAITALSLPPLGADAHEMRPAIVTASVVEGSHFEFKIQTNLEALIAAIPPTHKDTDEAANAATYKQLRVLSPEQLADSFRRFLPTWLDGIDVEVDGYRAPLKLLKLDVPKTGNTSVMRISTVTLTADLPSGGETYSWRYDKAFGSSVLRAKTASGKIAAIGWLKDGAVSPKVSVAGAIVEPWLQTVVEYVWLGFTHIVPKGLDHILFVLGLYFLSPALRPLLMQVTAFTLAHTITLALGLYDVVQVSRVIVEPLIALSIVYVAVENLLTAKLTPWRPIVVFGFGLLHGLGFASVLRDIGLPSGDYLLGLISFNVGVEAGQLAVIAAAWLLTGLWFSGRSWYRQRIVWPASICIAAIGMFWTVERLAGL